MELPSVTSVRVGIRVLAIPGSLREGSFNRRLLEVACSLAPPGLELVVWDGLKAVPPFDEDDENDPPASVQAMRAAIGGAASLLVATPEYNSSIPGQLKNAFDWASRPHGASVLEGKPVAVIGASPNGFGAVRAQADVRRVLTASGARVIDVDLAVARAHRAFNPEGELLDPSLRRRLQEVLGRLEAAAASVGRSTAA